MSAWGTSMRKGEMPSLTVLLLVNGPPRQAPPGRVASVLMWRRLGIIEEEIVPKLPSGSKNAGYLRATAAPAVPVASPARLDQHRARHPARGHHPHHPQ